MPHQVVWQKLSVTDQSNPAKPVEHILPRGAVLPDFVDPFTLFALSGSGAIRAVEEPDPALLAELAQRQPVLMPEHAPGIGDFDDPSAGLERTSVGGLATSPDAETVDHTTREGRAKLAADMGDQDAATRIKAEPERRGTTTRTPTDQAAAGTGAGVERPADTAPVADWRTYAESKARTDAERAKIRETTKAELITRYG